MKKDLICGRGDHKKDLSGDKLLEAISAKTLQPFPDNGEVYEYQKDGKGDNYLVKYRMKWGALKNNIYKFSNSDLQIVSASDDWCFWKILA